MQRSELTFQSILFGPGGDYEGLTLTCGVMIRQFLDGGTTEQDWKDNFQKISFSQLFKEVNKKVYIGMYVDYNNPVPVVRIERVRDLRQEGTSFQALNIDELSETIDADELYATVRLGSSTVSDKISPAVSFPGDISFVGFKEEQFIVLGECNIDREIDLVSDFIIDHNIIEDCFIGGETQYDDEHIFIMCDVDGGNYLAQQDNLAYQVGSFPVFYNLALNGAAVMENYFNGIPLSIVQRLGNADNTFFATRTTSQAPTFGAFTVILFDNDSTGVNHDVNNNYNPATGRYIIPASGLYTFDAIIDQFYTPLAGLTYDVNIYLEHWDSSPALIQRVQVGVLNGAGYSTGTFSYSFSTVATDFVVCTFREAFSFKEVASVI